MNNRYTYYVGQIENDEMDIFNGMLKLFPGVEVADSDEIEQEYYDDHEGLDYYYHYWNVRLRVDVFEADHYSRLMKAFDFEVETERRAS